MHPIIKIISDALYTIANQVKPKQLELRTTTRIIQESFGKSIDQRGHEQRKLNLSVLKETTEVVYVDGSMKLEGWQTTKRYDIHGMLTSELKERLDK